MKYKEQEEQWKSVIVSLEIMVSFNSPLRILSNIVIHKVKTIICWKIFKVNCWMYRMEKMEFIWLLWRNDKLHSNKIILYRIRCYPNQMIGIHKHHFIFTERFFDRLLSFFFCYKLFMSNNVSFGIEWKNHISTIVPVWIKKKKV